MSIASIFVCKNSLLIIKKTLYATNFHLNELKMEKSFENVQKRNFT